MEKVVITGMGVCSPIGCSLGAFWNGLLSGKTGVVSLQDEKLTAYPTKIGALVDGFEAIVSFSAKELRRMSRSSQLAVIAADLAIADAGLKEPGADPQDIGVMIGSSIGGYSASDPFFEDFHLRGRYGPLIIPVSMNVGPSSNVSIRNNFQGPLMTVDAACASGPHSIGYAFNMIRFGQLDIAVTGGADSPFSPGVLAAWCALHALSERNDCPAKACRPFSADRDGMVLGEGAGVLILESESSARRRGRRIWGEIKGYAATSDSYHLTQPTQEGPIRAMQKALRNAGLGAGEIDYINAHGTGTKLNDKTETSAIKHLFGERAYGIPVVSNKAALGHSIAASGALELIGCVLSLRDQVIPPTINYRVPDPECDLDYVTEGRRSLRMENVMSNSFAFGGSNAVLVVGRYSPEKTCASSS
jgi:3-oxoacyl-[acyl-carrier-protein] synthase II